jgi:ABC-type antimicrobial peptide transport system permease subunit
MKTMQKKEVENLQGFILSIVGIAVVLAVGLIVLGQLSLQTTAGSYERNATNAIAAQLGTVPNWIGILITVALAFIVLGYFYNR